jgi:hypothetical protein
MELPLARLGHCPQCGLQFLICSRCDRGQRYGGPVCAQTARRASLRAAGKRYQAGRVVAPMPRVSGATAPAWRK